MYSSMILYQFRKLLHSSNLNRSYSMEKLRYQQYLFSTLLTSEARSSAIAKLSSSGDPFAWEEDPSGRNAITKTFHFTDFKQAWKWMNKVAILAEEMNHHPEWKNIYGTVEITLSTHDCGGISDLDIVMAEKMDMYAAEILPLRKKT